jgi:hypothetical protein
MDMINSFFNLKNLAKEPAMGYPYKGFLNKFGNTEYRSQESEFRRNAIATQALRPHVILSTPLYMLESRQPYSEF